jgi:hypothetical protein
VNGGRNRLANAHNSTTAIFQAGDRRYLRSNVGSLARLPAPGSRACRVRFPAQEAFPAINRTPLCRFERNRRLTPALGATGHCFGFGVAAAGPLSLRLAWLAALWFVLKVFVVEEVLFSRCKYEICSAINTLENAILKLRHGNWSPF